METIIYYSTPLFTYICYAAAFYLNVYAAFKLLKGVRYAVISDTK